MTEKTTYNISDRGFVGEVTKLTKHYYCRGVHRGGTVKVREAGGDGTLVDITEESISLRQLAMRLAAIVVILDGCGRVLVNDIAYHSAVNYLRC